MAKEPYTKFASFSIELISTRVPITCMDVLILKIFKAREKLPLVIPSVWAINVLS